MGKHLIIDESVVRDLPDWRVLIDKIDVSHDWQFVPRLWRNATPLQSASAIA